MNAKVAFAPIHAMQNRLQIENCNQCGCYYCLAIFEAKEVVAYTDANRTAVCPRCGHDCVLPDYADEALLRQVHEYWLT